MIHDLYIGYFAKDEDGAARLVRGSDGISRLVVVRPLEPAVVEAVLKQVTEGRVTLESIPESWRLWVADDHVVCDHYTPSRTALRFVVRLAESTGCDLLDSNLFPPVTVAQLEQQLRRPSRWID